MNTTLWIAAGVLALLFLMAGMMKISQPREKLVASGMAWAKDAPVGAIKAIGAAEVLGAVGLVLPAAVNVAAGLAPWAALGLTATMLGAAVVHARRKENQMIGVSLVLLTLAALVAWGRFGPYAF